MSQFYETVSKATSPLTLGVAKVYLKIDPLITEDDVLIQTLIDSCTQWGENYAGRDFRAVTYRLLIDSLSDRICLRRNEVDSITSITHLVSGSPVTISDTIYSLRKNPTYSEVVRVSSESWPTNTDDVEQAYEINFTTKAHNDLNFLIDCIQRHVIRSYMNRGDCDNLDDLAKKAGVTSMYDQIRIVRV